MTTGQILVTAGVALVVGAGVTGAVVIVKRQGAADKERAAMFELERIRAQAAVQNTATTAPKVSTGGINLGSFANTATGVISAVNGLRGLLRF